MIDRNDLQESIIDGFFSLGDESCWKGVYGEPLKTFPGLTLETSEDKIEELTKEAVEKRIGIHNPELSGDRQTIAFFFMVFSYQVESYHKGMEHRQIVIERYGTDTNTIFNKNKEKAADAKPSNRRQTKKTMPLL